MACVHAEIAVAHSGQDGNRHHRDSAARPRRSELSYYRRGDHWCPSPGRYNSRDDATPAGTGRDPLPLAIAP